MKLRLIWRWYDLWVGVYIDRKRQRIYVAPFPTVLVVLDFAAGEPWTFRPWPSNPFTKAERDEVRRELGLDQEFRQEYGGPEPGVPEHRLDLVRHPTGMIPSGRDLFAATCPCGWRTKGYLPSVANVEDEWRAHVEVFQNEPVTEGCHRNCGNAAEVRCWSCGMGFCREHCRATGPSGRLCYHCSIRGERK